MSRLFDLDFWTVSVHAENVNIRIGKGAMVLILVMTVGMMAWLW